jgi:hypothetical protein
MDAWKSGILKVVNLLFGAAGKASQVEITICIVAAVLACVMILKSTCKTLGGTMAEKGRATGLAVGGIVLLLAVAVAVGLYLCPLIKSAGIGKWLPLISCVIVILAVITPVGCLLFKSKYFGTLFSILLSIAGAVAIVFLVHGAFGAIRSGDKELKKTKQRTESVNDFLKK